MASISVDLGVIILSHRLPGSAPPLEYGIIVQDAPPRWSPEVPSFFQPNIPSTVLLLVTHPQQPESGRKVVRRFDCIINPTNSDGSRRAPEWSSPEAENMSLASDFKVNGVYVAAHVTADAADYAQHSLKKHVVDWVHSPERTRLRLGAQSLNWAMTMVNYALELGVLGPSLNALPWDLQIPPRSRLAMETAYSKTIGSIIQRDYIDNCYGEGPVYSYSAESTMPSSERCAVGCIRFPQGLSLPGAYIMRLPLPA